MVLKYNTQYTEWYLGEKRMKISTRGRYALRLMLDLAANGNGDYASLKSVSERQNISIKYLEQIITLLSRAGYVVSTRGPHGGYRLAMEPRAYTPGMIFRLTEGSLAPVTCLEDDPNRCERCASCVPLVLYNRLDEAIKQVVDSVTLQDLLEMSPGDSNLENVF